MNETERSRRRYELIVKKAMELSAPARAKGIKKGDISRAWLEWARNAGEFTLAQAQEAWFRSGGIGTLQSYEPHLINHCEQVRKGVRGGRLGPTSVWKWSEEVIEQQRQSNLRSEELSRKLRDDDARKRAEVDASGAALIDELFGA